MGSAAQLSATLSIDHADYLVEVEAQEPLSGAIDELQVSDRLGNVARKLTLADGSVFVTLDNDGIDSLFQNKTRFSRAVHYLESHLAWVGVALVISTLFVLAFFKFGVPWAGTKIAHALPHKVNEVIADQTFEFLDDYLFEPSKLSDEKTAEITRHFESNLVPLDNSNEGIEYTLHFRDWSDDDESIPNALALPSGHIILTDKFVELSKTQDQIDAVLLHEMGHVVHRHSLQMVVESTLVTTLTMMVVGDNNGLADLGLGLGALLVSSNYSRAHESEADLYAFEHMLKANIDPQAFSEIMTRMTNFMLETKQGDEAAETENTNGAKTLVDYLSSHPSTEERVQLAKKYSQCFEKKLIPCN